MSPRATTLLLVASAMVACSSYGVAPADDEERTGEIAQAVTAQGDWSGYGNGQCVIGAQAFYKNRFGVALKPTGVQSGNVGNCAYLGACMYWVSNAARPDPAVWDRHDWGSTKPQTYDLVIYPPSGNNPYGHVASVDHLESGDPGAYGALWIMDSNFNGNELKASAIHTYNLKPYGFYRLKSLAKPPVPCDTKAGGFAFSCDGPEGGMSCVNVNEPGDPDSWGDNNFCSKADLGMKWSAAGPIAGMDCTNVAEGAEPHAAAWKDNFLCLPDQAPFAFSWSSAGPTAGKTCVNWSEPADQGGSWSDNYLCATSVNRFSNGGFTFSADGTAGLEGKECVSVNEPNDPDTWSDNVFCSDAPLGMKWSASGPLAGMDCTNVAEGAEPLADAWKDDYLCTPKGAPWRFTWSSAGQLAGKTCVRWFDHAEASPTWLDNWMCAEKVVPPAGNGGAGGSAGAAGKAGAPGKAGASAKAGAAGKAGGAAGAPSGSAGKAGAAAPGPGYVTVGVGDDSASESGCSTGGGSGAWEAGLLALAALARRRKRLLGARGPHETPRAVEPFGARRARRRVWCTTLAWASATSSSSSCCSRRPTGCSRPPRSRCSRCERPRSRRAPTPGAAGRGWRSRCAPSQSGSSRRCRSGSRWWARPRRRSAARRSRSRSRRGSPRAASAPSSPVKARCSR